MVIQEALPRLARGDQLSRKMMREVMLELMQGEITSAQIGGLLMALRIRGESIDEIIGAAQAMRSLATPVEIEHDHLIDLVGTGGDGANLFNVSTAACFVVAAAGGRVAKHGNRSVSSSSGSSDVLEALGASLDLTPSAISQCVHEIGLGFMFAPMHHGAMRHAVTPRKELGLRTLFNILGPLTNPAGVLRQVLGVYDPGLCRPIAEVLKSLGSQHAMVVHSDDGLDELSISKCSLVAELKDGSINEFKFDPREFGHAHQSLAGLTVQNASQSADLIRSALLPSSNSTETKRSRSIIALNAGAGLYVANIAATLSEGIVLAEDMIVSGKAAAKLDSFVRFTNKISGSSS